jgi:hypothetical protein
MIFNNAELLPAVDNLEEDFFVFRIVTPTSKGTTSDHGDAVGTALSRLCHPANPEKNQTATSCAGAPLARLVFFAFAGAKREQAASPAVSATPGLRDTIAATMAPSINSAS